MSLFNPLKAPVTLARLARVTLPLVGPARANTRLPVVIDTDAGLDDAVAWTFGQANFTYRAVVLRPAASPP